MPLFRTQFTEEEAEFVEILSKEDFTIPDQALSITEIKQRALAGSLQGFGIYHPDQGLGEDDLDLDVVSLCDSPDSDLTDLMTARQDAQEAEQRVKRSKQNVSDSE